ncbi:MAG: hypothetical protein M1819_003786 [Sarea resinae]|nr:MAG: hypothetical protein M1819_003786 [Sarea resinae]
MDPGTAGALYGVETAVEATAAAAKGIADPTLPLHATFTPLSLPKPFPRSSHTLSIIRGRAYVFGGEITPRNPVDNAMHIFTLPSSSVPDADYRSVSAVTETSSINSNHPGTKGEEEEQLPAPRVGHTASVIGDRIFVFGGRGGKDMKPLEEHGRVWIFDTGTGTWSYLDPAPGSPYPPARSYHASAATEYPPNPKHQQGALKFSLQFNLSEDTAAETSGEHLATAVEYGTLFIHAGCPSSGRLSDLWALDLASRVWVRFADAPGSARGGTSLVTAQERLYRFGGFDGQSELGGQLDVLEPFSSSGPVAAAAAAAKRNENDGAGDAVPFLLLQPVTAEWKSFVFSPTQLSPDKVTTTITTPSQDNDTPPPPPLTDVPGPRSVAGLHVLSTGQGRTYLVLFLGERSPSPRSLGHDAAGAFWDDVWCFQLPTRGAASAARWKDAARWIFGAKDEAKWARVRIAGGGSEGSETDTNDKLLDVDKKDAGPDDVSQSPHEPETGKKGAQGPGARGWFASAMDADVDPSSIFLWGGVDSKNERLGDAWVLSVSA